MAKSPKTDIAIVRHFYVRHIRCLVQRLKIVFYSVIAAKQIKNFAEADRIRKA